MKYPEICDVYRNQYSNNTASIVPLLALKDIPTELKP